MDDNERLERRKDEMREARMQEVAATRQQEATQIKRQERIRAYDMGPEEQARIWNRGPEEDLRAKAAQIDLESEYYQFFEEPTKDLKRQRSPKPTKRQLLESDRRFLNILKERLDVEGYKNALHKIHERMLGAQIIDMLPPEGHPTSIVREELLLTPNEQRRLRMLLESIQTVIIHSKKASSLPPIDGVVTKRWEVGNTILTASDVPDSRKESKLRDLSITGNFDEATIKIVTNTAKEVKVEIQFPFEDIHAGELPPYNSKMVPFEGLTLEEQVIASYLINQAHVNIFADAFPEAVTT